MTGRPRTPLFATINVTTNCNLGCAYCFMQPLSGENMSFDDFESVVDELATLKVFFINLSGGEPFVHPKIGDFIRLAHQRFHHVMVLSNGSVLRQEHRRAIGEVLAKKGAFSLQVSLDAVDPDINKLTRGRTAQTLRNIEILTNMGAHVIVATVVTNRNVCSLVDSIRFLSRYTRHFHLMSVQDIRKVDGVEECYGLPLEGELEIWSRVRELAKAEDLVINTPLNYEGYRGCASGSPCMAAFSHIVIDPSLRVRPCDRIVDVVIGDLHSESIHNIWNGQSVRAVIESDVPYCRRLPAGVETHSLAMVPIT